MRDLLWQYVLPPNGLITLAILGALVAAIGRRGRRAGAWTALACLLTYVVLISPPAASGILDLLESRAGTALDEPALQRLMRGERWPGAVVILGGGMREDVREPGAPSALTADALERVRHGAWIARLSGLPVLVSGGRRPGFLRAEADLMADALVRDFGVPVRWIENESPDTAANARESAGLLKAAGVSRVILVTHAFHMPRARAAFVARGLEVVAAPAAFLAGRGAPQGWIRTGIFDDRAWFAWHELFGLAWYRWRGLIGPAPAQ